MEFVRLPAFVLGFHGCDRAVAERVISRKASLRPSRNDYDWLGHGIYFWENDPRRAALWAREQSGRARSKGRKFEPAVVGAVIDLGRCLDLLNSTSIEIVEQAYGYM